MMPPHVVFDLTAAPRWCTVHLRADDWAPKLVCEVKAGWVGNSTHLALFRS